MAGLPELGARPRRLGDAQVRCGLGGGQDEEVRDAQRASDVDKVLQLIPLGLLAHAGKAEQRHAFDTGLWHS